MEQYSFVNSSHSDLHVNGQIVLSKTLEPLGTYEMDVIFEVFTAAINIHPNYQRGGIGFDAFKYCFDLLHKSNDLTKFRACWSTHQEYSHLPSGGSVNLTTYSYLVNAGFNNIAALWQTPTGKWLSRLGFDAVSLEESSRNSVKALFYK